MESMASHYGIAPAVQVGAPLAPWARMLETAARAILRVVEAHAEARQTRGTAAELSRLSDRELADIGLTRGDVDLMAVSRF
jgi:uncharacterized protein YjiS (DUF1127 family)